MKINLFKVYLFTWYFLLGLGLAVTMVMVGFGLGELIDLF